MVDNRPVLQLRTRWFPTRVSGERSMLMEIEFVVNGRHQDKPSMSEIVWATGNIKQALADLPPIVPPRVRRELERLLQPWPPGRYTGAYRRTGGILNLFTPPWGEPQDEVWNKMIAEWRATTFPDDQAKRAALIELEQRWNNTPHPFFAGLTPAQVMVGGGAQEAKLADEFLTQLGKIFGKRAFASEGDMLIQTLMLLRGWQVEPQPNGQTPMQIILAERTELLNRRAHLLAESK
jgi:hypothetical protein